MNALAKISVALLLIFAFPSCNAQLKNVKTDHVMIHGNCGICEKTIETAGTVKKIALVDWNKDTKMAALEYDSTKTSVDEILKRIALAGYDSDKYLAPDAVYAKLPACCQYPRANKVATAPIEVVKPDSAVKEEVVVVTNPEVNQLQVVFENYFSLKDALVKSDGKLASTLAKNLLVNINAVKMEKLSTEEHTVWMSVLDSLKLNTEEISATTNIEKQRKSFSNLSSNFYSLLKVSQPQAPVYYQHCPMYNDGEGANWLSKESAIKNPYYGSQMLTCGKTVETIK